MLTRSGGLGLLPEPALQSELALELGVGGGERDRVTEPQRGPGLGQLEPSEGPLVVREGLVHDNELERDDDEDEERVRLLPGGPPRAGYLQGPLLHRFQHGCPRREPILRRHGPSPFDEGQRGNKATKARPSARLIRAVPHVVQHLRLGERELDR